MSKDNSKDNSKDTKDANRGLELSEYKFKMTREYAEAEAYDLVKEYEPEHLDRRTVRDAVQTAFGDGGYAQGYTILPLLDICAAIIYNRGVLAYAAKQLGITSRSIYYYKNNHPAVKEAIKIAREIRLDIWERKLDYLIEERDEMIPLIFGLKTQGKSRGYIENQVVYQHIDVTVLTTEQLERLAAGEEPVQVLGDKVLKGLRAPKQEVIDAQVQDVD